MPELPEVEVLRRSLAPRLEGRRLGRVVVRESRLREPVSVAKLRRDCSRQRVLDLRRRAKYLLVDLTGDKTLVVHLGMSGRLTLGPKGRPEEAHEHVAIEVEDDGELRFRDPRRFGLVFSAPTRLLERDRHFCHLGVEPLDGAFDGAYLAELAAGRKAPIKSFLMDARNVVGVGNIYVCEALFRAGVHPWRRAGRIARPRWDRIAASIREVLAEAIAEGGTTLNDFADGSGEAGYFQVALDVYGREGEDCSRCGRTLRRKTLSNRGTFYCPGCQR